MLAALVAMLIKSGRREALRYVHAGWIAALALGAVTWVAASYVVTLSGASREVTEGVTALIAAGMLLYVGFWMHRHAHAARWKTFIETQVQAALSGRTRWALASIAFLAVYREAFETVLFYQALWIEAGPSGRVAVAGGFAAAAAGLVLLAWPILKMGLRLPVGWFFGVGSALMAVLAVVLAGKGIAALQHAGRLPVEPLDLPRSRRSACIDVAGRAHPARAGAADPHRLDLLPAPPTTCRLRSRRSSSTPTAPSSTGGAGCSRRWWPWAARAGSRSHASSSWPTGTRGRSWIA